MNKRVAIIQSNYIPWRGYFDIINSVDAFVLLDDVQYTRRDWRNRNQIKTAQGLQWLTIPVDVKGQFDVKIKDVIVAGRDWSEDHWNKISQAYKKAPHFATYRDVFEETYRGCTDSHLSQINYRFLSMVNSLLEIKTPLLWSHDFLVSQDKSQRLLEICLQLKATTYVSGPAAKDYLQVAQFHEAGVQVEWMSYEGYTSYHQLHGFFEPNVSIIDLIFNEGPATKQYFKRFSHRL
ncbi:MAG: WbqC family protein [Cyclobacteriaceae bacterium]|nr:WbqC family protein [Cyclobacteriaceae bacterium]